MSVASSLAGLKRSSDIGVASLTVVAAAGAYSSGKGGEFRGLGAFRCEMERKIDLPALGGGSRARQWGVVTRAQLIELGLGDARDCGLGSERAGCAAFTAVFTPWATIG